MKWFEKPELHFAVGIEDTFVPQARMGERPLDEYELTQHYQFWHSDLGLARQTGASMIRWGIPWYRINPGRAVWRWDWLDRVVDRLLELNLEPIVDLMHYGTPTWLDNEFINAAYPEAVAEYAGRVAERYRGRLNIFTPLNEPLLNVIYCGQFGYWPPNLRGDDGFVQVLRGITRGIVQTQRAVTEASGGDATFVHVEASFRFTGDVEAFAEEVTHLRHRAYLVEDLVTGKVMSGHPLVEYLQRSGFTDRDLDWAAANTAVPDVMGVNYYPTVSTEQFRVGERHTGGPQDIRPRVNSWTEGLEDVLLAYAERYGRPVFLTETKVRGPVEQGLRWMDESVAHVLKLRSNGLNVVGYTWWGVFNSVAWHYREGLEPPTHYLRPGSLWDLIPDEVGVLHRVPTPLVDRYREHATATPGPSSGSGSADFTA